MTAYHDRAFAGEDDIHAITRFLLDTYRINQTLHNWEPRRWQGSMYYGSEAEQADVLAAAQREVRIWQDDAANIVGVVIPEDAGWVFLQVHPQHRTIEAEMIAWAEANLAQPDDSGRRQINIHAFEYDTFRADLLRQHGYTQTDAYDNLRRRSMDIPVPDFSVPSGYTLREMRIHPDDWQEMANLLNAAFRRTFHNAEEYRNFQRAPIYRAELDIVVIAPDGTLAANAGFTAHEDESFAVIEPVATHPDHHNRGLARAAIAEGLRRVQALGIQTVFVGAWHSNPAANHTYESMGLTDPLRQYVWHKQW